MEPGDVFVIETPARSGYGASDSACRQARTVHFASGLAFDLLGGFGEFLPVGLPEVLD